MSNTESSNVLSGNFFGGAFDDFSWWHFSFKTVRNKNWITELCFKSTTRRFTEEFELLSLINHQRLLAQFPENQQHTTERHCIVFSRLTYGHEYRTNVVRISNSCNF